MSGRLIGFGRSRATSREANPQGLANTVWAQAAPGFQDEELQEAVRGAAYDGLVRKVLAA